MQAQDRGLVLHALGVGQLDGLLQLSRAYHPRVPQEFLVLVHMRQSRQLGVGQAKSCKLPLARRGSR